MTYLQGRANFFEAIDHRPLISVNHRSMIYGGDGKYETVRHVKILLLPVGDHSSRDELSTKAASSQDIYDMLTETSSDSP